MADEILATPAPVAATPEVAPAAPVNPSVAPVEVVQVNVVEAAPAVAPTPAPDPTTVPEAPAAPAEPIKADTGATTLLAETKPAETPEAVQPQEPITEGGQSDEPAPPPTYEPFKLPENISLDTGKISEFTNLLSEAELAKGDHTKMQEFGQKMVDFHINETKKSLENYNTYMIEAFEKQKNDWKEAFLKDPEIGGNRWKTTVNSALSFITTHGGTPEQQAEIRTLMDSSGLGNHPAVIRLLANAMTAMAEPKPLASVKPIPQVKSRTQTMYGQS